LGGGDISIPTTQDGTPLSTTYDEGGVNYAPVSPVATGDPPATTNAGTTSVAAATADSGTTGGGAQSRGSDTVQDAAPGTAPTNSTPFDLNSTQPGFGLNLSNPNMAAYSPNNPTPTSMGTAAEVGIVIVGGVAVGAGLLLEAPILIVGGVVWEVGWGIYAGYEAYSSYKGSTEKEQQNRNNSLQDGP
jgi:hypothetical protein